MVFSTLSFLLVFICIISIIIHYFKFPLIVGYIIVGILLGPAFFNLNIDHNLLDLFSKIGIVSLLFIIGLNINIKSIKKELKESFILGISQIIITAISGFLFSYYVFDFKIIESILISSAFTLSSTIVILKLLTDKGDIDNLYSKISLGVLLIQDFFAAIILLSLSIGNTIQIQNIKISSIIISFLFKIILLVFLFYILNKYILPKLTKIFSSSQELLLLFSAAFAFSYSYLFEVLGFSLEIGALFAGIILSSSIYAKDIASRFRPIRDFFIIIFFLLLGLKADFSGMSQYTMVIIIFLIFVVIINPIIMFLIMNVLGHRTRTSFFTALTMGQVSEFSLVILSVAKIFNYVNNDLFSIVLIVMFLSICISSYMLLYSENIYKFLSPFLHKIEIKKTHKRIIESKIKNLDIIIFGYDKIGSKFLALAKKRDFNYLIIDIDKKAIDRAKEDRANILFGDASNIEFLEENNIFSSRMIVSTIPYFNINKFLIEKYKSHNSKNRFNFEKNKIIISIAKTKEEAISLYQVGADFVVMPYELGGDLAVEYIDKFNFNQEKFYIAKEKELEKLLIKE